MRSSKLLYHIIVLFPEDCTFKSQNLSHSFEVYITSLEMKISFCIINLISALVIYLHNLITCNRVFKRIRYAIKQQRQSCRYTRFHSKITLSLKLPTNEIGWKLSVESIRKRI